MPPKFSFRKILIEKVEYVALGLLLPLFFAFSGLRTQIGLLNDAHAWGCLYADYFSCSSRKIRRKHVCRQIYGVKLERQPVDRCVDEYPRIDGADCTEYRL